MGQQWTRTINKLTGVPSRSGGAPGAKPHVKILEKDVLTLCEDGDLLLMREQVANTHMRVTMDLLVARDISRMQHGHFPAQRVTSLPGTKLPCSIVSNERLETMASDQPWTPLFPLDTGAAWTR